MVRINYQCQFTSENTSDETVSTSITQPAITCSKLTIATLEQGEKYV